jgi:hypothetical protein
LGKRFEIKDDSDIDPKWRGLVDIDSQRTLTKGKNTKRWVDVRCGNCGKTRTVEVNRISVVTPKPYKTTYCPKCVGRKCFPEIAYLTEDQVPEELREYIVFSNQPLKEVGSRGKRVRSIEVTCPSCGKNRFAEVRNLKVREFRTICAPCSVTGENAAVWRGGTERNKEGYVMMSLSLVPPEDRYLIEAERTRTNKIRQHRYVAAKKLGNPIPKGMVVLHLDGHKDHNWPENLEVGTHQENVNDHVTARKLGVYWRSRSEVMERWIVANGGDPAALLRIAQMSPDAPSRIEIL